MDRSQVLLVGAPEAPCAAIAEVVEVLPELELRDIPAIPEVLLDSGVLDDSDDVGEVDLSCLNDVSWDDVVLMIVWHKASGDPTLPIAALARARALEKTPPVIVLAEQYRAEDALALFRAGASDYLVWPLNPSRLSDLIRSLSARGISRQAAATAVAHAPAAAAPVAVAAPARAQAEARRSTLLPIAAPQAHPHANGHAPVRNSAAGIGCPSNAGPETSGLPPRLLDHVRRVAPHDTTLLLAGETGSGKTRLAHLIHELSSRKNEPLMVVNCGALSANLIESEMFGHVRGAFTGADRDRVGKFAEVGAGTLFLDEIDTLPLSTQAKLLRVVEDRVFEPVGSNKSLPVRARIIAASNRPLADEVSAQRFRADLFYRLNVVELYLPPLRERRGAIPSLVAKFVREFADRNGQAIDGIEVDALRMLEAHDWPGNIRELRNVIERAIALSGGTRLTPEDLPDAVRIDEHLLAPTCLPNALPFQIAPSYTAHDDADELFDGELDRDRDEVPASRPLVPSAVAHDGHMLPPVRAFDFGSRAHRPHASSETLTQCKENAEYDRILRALEQNNNNRLRAAKTLGISRVTLYKKLHKYGVLATA